MVEKSKVYAIALTSALLISGVYSGIPYNFANHSLCVAVDTSVQDGKHDYEDLYELRVNIDKNPINPYYDAGTRDYSGLEVSIFTVGADGKETKVMSNASLEELKAMYDVNITEAPGGGAFLISISAYSTALNKIISGSAEFYMEKITDNEITAIRSEIVNLPQNTVKYADAELDLSGLTLSIWEITKDGTETEVFTNVDLETIKKRYSVHISYKASENDGEGICEITIYTNVLGMEIKTTSEFTYAIGGLKPTTKGDVNNDGDFNVSDVVLLQKWLLAVPDTHLANWKAADFCEDERLDVFDLCLMKRELISNSTTTTYPVENPEVIDEFTPCTRDIYDIQDPSKFYIVIKCQYSTPDRIWTIDDFIGVDNIKSITQTYQENPYRTVLEVKLADQVSSKMLSMIHSIEALNMEEIKEFRFVDHATGLQ